MAKVTNSEHRESVISKVYADAIALDWLHLSNARRSEQYSRWLADPEVGGMLGQWMSPEEARVWLKDGVMKEFKRAMAGEGPFAAHLSDHPFGAKNVVKRTLGDGWAVDGVVGTKPLHCTARRGDESQEIIWGDGGDAKHLLWAALEDAYRNPNGRSLVVVLETLPRPVSPSDKRWLSFVANRMGVDLTFTTI